MREKLTSRWRSTTTTDSAITDGLAANWLSPGAHCLTTLMIFRYTGMIDRREGHWDDATRNLERALELDPRNFITLQQLRLCLRVAQHRYADEVRTYDRALTIMPGDPVFRINLALVALDWRADIKPYQATLATLVAENPDLPLDLDALDSALCERPADRRNPGVLTNYPRDGVVPLIRSQQSPRLLGWRHSLVARVIQPKRKPRLPPRAEKSKRQSESSPTSRPLSAC